MGPAQARDVGVRPLWRAACWVRVCAARLPHEQWAESVGLMLGWCGLRRVRVSVS